MASSIPHESIELNADEDEIQAFLLNSLKQNWIQENNSSLIIKKLTDGLSNLIFSVRSSDDHGVIVKIYGKNSDLIVNRQAEIEFLIYLSKFHLSPAIVLTFNNGFIYDYVPGISIQNGDEEKA
jgi:ethanolamine kinase